MLSFIICTVFVLLYTGSMVAVFNRKFGECIIPAIILPGIVMYFSALFFGAFVPGIIVNMLPVLVFPMLLLRNKSNVKKIKENMFTLGFVVFIAVVVALVFIDYNRVYTEWDELSHWGMMVKEMFRTGVFYSEQVSHLYAHKEYPPFAALLELLFCRISGGYSEMIVSFAIHLVCFSFLIVYPVEIIFEKLQNCHIYSCLQKVAVILSYIVIVITMVISMDMDHKLMTIYTDGLIALELFGGLLLVYVLDVVRVTFFDLFSLSMMLGALVLTKQIGFVFAALVIFYFVVKLILSGAESMSMGRLLEILICIFVFPVVLWFSWRVYISGIELPGQQFSFDRIDLGEVMSIIKGGGTEYEQQVVQTYTRRLLKKGLLGGNIKIPMTFILPVICGVIACGLSLNRKKDNKRNDILLGIVMTALVAGYVVTMFILYLFCFPNEKPAVCYSRYMSSIIIPIVGCLLVTVIIAAIDSQNKRVLTVTIVSLFVFTAVFFDIGSLKYLRPAFLTEDKRAHFREIGDCIYENTLKDTSVYIVGDSNANYQYYVGYYANENLIDFRAAKNFLELDYTDVAVREAIRLEMLDNDYVFVDECDDEFTAAYGDLVDGGEFTEGTLYEVLDDGQTGLRSIASICE